MSLKEPRLHNAPQLRAHLDPAWEPSDVSAVSPAALVQQARSPRPCSPRPIIMLGAGGIVRAAHLPAYRKAGFPVHSIADVVADKAAEIASGSDIPFAFDDVVEAIAQAPKHAVFDVAVPASAMLPLVEMLPEGSAVLLQKPFGESLAEAEALLAACRRRRLVAAVNFQLRYAPNHLAAIALALHDLLGELHELEVHVRVHTPWHLWSFLAGAPRLEILYHSIHYLDLVRAWMGEPRGIRASTTCSPLSPGLAAVRSDLLLDYGPDKRVVISTSHGHGVAEMQASWVQWQGTLGSIRMEMGVNLDYPRGKPDSLAYARAGDEHWQELPIVGMGNWFPDAFAGTMGALQAFVEGSASSLPTRVEDAFRTMLLVEAAYQSSDAPSHTLPIPRDA